jgi:hypothetical protein
MMRRHIAILWHERDRHRDLTQYAITRLAEFWRADGHDVRSIFGTERFDAADIVIVHVDLSVVPARYLEFATRFPIAVNGRVQDIRRTRFSRNLVQRNEAYAGPVIVKSNANHAGLVVERFLPERVGECYAVRNYQFLGDRWTCSRMLAPDPIVNAYTQIGTEPIDVHPEIEALRHELGFDYGKFDYVMHDGRPVLLDANKTTGAAGLPWTAELVAARRHRAEGLYSFFAQPVAV